MLYIYKNEGTNIIAIYIVTHILTVLPISIYMFIHKCVQMYYL